MEPDQINRYLCSPAGFGLAPKGLRFLIQIDGQRDLMEFFKTESELMQAGERSESLRLAGVL